MSLKKQKLVSLFTAGLLMLSLLPSPLVEAKTHKLPAKTLTEQEKRFIEDVAKNTERVSADQGDPEEIVRVIVQTNGNHSAIEAKIKELSDKATFRQEFDYLLNGFSLDIARKYVSEIRAIDGVSKVSYAKKMIPVMADAVELSKAADLWSKEFGSHAGEGMVISIIDTGIDVTHKDMRLSDPSKAKIKDIKQGTETQYTAKVPYGYNFADGNDVVIDRDELGKSMHGMHVAGIVAANATDEDLKAEKGIRGVAPEAQLLAMKVFSNDESDQSAFSDVVVKAIEESVRLGADVINMSLGADNGVANPDDPEIVAIRKATEAGVVCCVAAGNAAMSAGASDTLRLPVNTIGMTDNGSLGTPATGDEAFTVASQNNAKPTGFMGHILHQDTEPSEFLFAVGGQEEKWDKEAEYELVDVGLAKEDEVKSDLTGKIAFIRRGEIAFSEKLQRVQEHNAVGAIVANNQEGNFGMAGIESIEIPSVAVSQEVGAKLVEALGKHEKIKMSFLPDYTGSREISAFTSFGPTPELNFKPEVTAPGGNITSTLNHNEYGEMSGTSMATPHVAGSVALLMGALRADGFEPEIGLQKFVRLSLTNTAKPLIDAGAGTGLVVSPRRQGAGAINVSDAYKNRVTITSDEGKGVHSLHEFDGSASFTLNFTNYSDKDKTYTVDPGAVYTENVAKNSPAQESVLSGASATVSEQKLTVPAHGTASLTVNVSTGNASLNQFVEGYITFKSEDGAPNLSFPYMGFCGDWGKEGVFDKPKGDAESLYDYTGLVDKDGSYLGASFDIFTFSQKIDPEKIAISPNGDGYYDIGQVVLAMLRNVKTVHADVVKEKSDSAKPVVRIGYEDYVRRSLHSAEKHDSGFSNGLWDGSVYNEKTGEYEAVEDGQYYIRLTADTFSNKTTQQYLYLPIKVDVTKPILEIISQNSDDTEFTVKFKAKDEGIGLDNGTVGYYVDNERLQSAEPVEGEKDTYIVKIKKADLSEGHHVLTIGVLDGVYNISSLILPLSDKTVYFHNLPEDEAWVNARNKYLLEDGKFLLSGTASSDIKKLTVMGVETTPDEEGFFEVAVALNEGSNTLTWQARNEKNEVIAQDTDVAPQVLRYDITAPELKITNPADGAILRYTSDNKKVSVSGTVSDNLGGKVKVNVGSTLNVPVDESGNFTGEAPADWTNKMTIRAIDEAGNESTAEVKTLNSDTEVPLKVWYDGGISHLMFINDTHALVEDGKLNVQGHLNRPVGQVLIAGEEVPVADDLTFSHLVSLQEIENNIGVVIKEADGTIAYDSGLMVYYDKTLPLLTIDQEIEPDDTIYTNTETTDITGTITDNGYGYTLFINGEVVKNFLELASPGGDAIKQDFSYTAPSQDGDYLMIEVTDGFGNSFAKKYRFILDQEAPNITISGDNLKGDKLTIPSILNISTDDPEATVEISLDNQPYESGTEISTPGGHTLVVRATDKAGNVSEETLEFEAKVAYKVSGVAGKVKTDNNDWSGLVEITDSLGDKVKPISVQPVGKIDRTPGTRDIKLKVQLPDGSEQEVTVSVTFEGEKPEPKPTEKPTPDKTKPTTPGKPGKPSKPSEPVKPSKPGQTQKPAPNTNEQPVNPDNNANSGGSSNDGGRTINHGYVNSTPRYYRLSSNTPAKGNANVAKANVTTTATTKAEVTTKATTKATTSVANDKAELKYNGVPTTTAKAESAKSSTAGFPWWILLLLLIATGGVLLWWLIANRRRD